MFSFNITGLFGIKIFINKVNKVIFNNDKITKMLADTITVFSDFKTKQKIIRTYGRGPTGQFAIQRLSKIRYGHLLLALPMLDALSNTYSGLLGMAARRNFMPSWNCINDCTHCTFARWFELLK